MMVAGEAVVGLAPAETRHPTRTNNKWAAVARCRAVRAAQESHLLMTMVLGTTSRATDTARTTRVAPARSEAVVATGVEA